MLQPLALLFMSNIQVPLSPLARSLTDPPAAGEVITATLSLQGKLPGNEVDAAPHVSLSATSFNFTADNCCTKAQTLEVTTLGALGTPCVVGCPNSASARLRLCGDLLCCDMIIQSLLIADTAAKTQQLQFWVQSSNLQGRLTLSTFMPLPLFGG